MSTIIICLIISLWGSLWLIKLSVPVWIIWEQTPWHWFTRSSRTKWINYGQWASVNLKMRLRLPVNIFSVKCKVVDRAVNRTFPSHWIIFAFIIYQIFRFSCGHSTQGSWLVIFLQVKIQDSKLANELTKNTVGSKIVVKWYRLYCNCNTKTRTISIKMNNNSPENDR